MFKGFYNLTSAMLSQGRRLDVIANNMTNVSTAGYKADTYTDSTFKEYVVSRIGNKDKSQPAQLGKSSYILAPSKLYTDYSQGVLEPTDQSLDFALDGDGFFAVQTANGTAYTRAGSFSLDDQRYLCLPGQGRILDISGEPIALGTDKINVDNTGAIYNEQGTYLGQIGVYSFQDNTQLVRDAQGLFTANGQQAAASSATVHQKMVERANVELVREMTSMLTAQRAFQSAAQVSKMYDELMGKAATNLGNV